MKLLRTLFVAGCLASLPATAHSAVIATINTYTTDIISITFSGAFDADTIGDVGDYLAIKNDWSNNQGINTEWFALTPIVVSNTVTIGGQFWSANVENSNLSFNDSIYFFDPSGTTGAPILAGTQVGGTFTLSGAGAFDPSDAATLEVLSGFSNSTNDWARLESSVQSANAPAVPLPSAVFLLLSGIGGLVLFSKRSRRRNLMAAS